MSRVGRDCRSRGGRRGHSCRFDCGLLGAGPGIWGRWVVPLFLVEISAKLAGGVVGVVGELSLLAFVRMLAPAM